MRTENERWSIFLDEILPHIVEVAPIDLFTKLSGMGFFNAPASRKYHGAYEGGLFDHSLNVMNALVTLTEREMLCWERPESPYIIGLFHDLCKCDLYTPIHENECIATDGNTNLYCPVLKGFEYNENMLLKGHGDKSVMIASQLMRLTEEEVLCIRYHMGSFSPSEEWNDYTRAVHKYVNVLFTHTADMLAAHVMEVEND